MDGMSDGLASPALVGAVPLLASVSAQLFCSTGIAFCILDPILTQTDFVTLVPILQVNGRTSMSAEGQISSQLSLNNPMIAFNGEIVSINNQILFTFHYGFTKNVSLFHSCSQST